MGAFFCAEANDANLKMRFQREYGEKEKREKEVSSGTSLAFYDGWYEEFQHKLDPTSGISSKY